jgi:hypothetical protein
MVTWNVMVLYDIFVNCNWFPGDSSTVFFKEIYCPRRLQIK